MEQIKKKKISTKDKLIEETIKKLIENEEEIVDVDEEEKEKDNKMAINLMFGFIKGITEKAINLMESIEDPIDIERKVILNKQSIIFNYLNDLCKLLDITAKVHNNGNEE